MGSLTKRSIKIVVPVVLCSLSVCTALGDGQGNSPVNVFEKDPVSGYYTWWRPQVVFDPQAIEPLQTAIENVQAEEAASVDLGAVFGQKEQSAFLFPLLATHGAKGETLLTRLLEEHRKAGFDNEWLLLIASLGRIPTQTALDRLEGELVYVMGEWDSYRTKKIGDKSVQLPVLDIRKPVIDAILACSAAQGRLSAERIESLCEQVGERHLIVLAWAAGLEWARNLASEELMLEIAWGGLEKCGKDDLDRGMNMEGVSDRLTGIRYVLLGPDDVWPLIRGLVIAKANEQTAAAQYLAVLYAGILTYQAYDGDGVYQIDADVANAIIQSNVQNSKGLDVTCKILKSCQPSAQIEAWNAFIEARAAKAPAEEDDFVASQVQRIHSSDKDPNRNPNRREIRIIKRELPGVYIEGFGGMRRP